MPYILSQKLPYIKPTLKRSVNINPLKMSYILNQKIPYIKPGVTHRHTDGHYLLNVRFPICMAVWGERAARVNVEREARKNYMVREANRLQEKLLLL